MSNNIKNNNKVRFMKQLLLISFMILTVNILAAQDARDYLLKARALMERGHTEESVDLLSKAVSTINDSRLYVLRGDVHSDMGKYSEAISDYKSANEISQGSGEYGLARIYALKGDANTSLSHLEKNIGSSFKKLEKEIMLDPAFAAIENTPEWRLFWKKERYNIFERRLPELEYYISTGNKVEAKNISDELERDYPGDNSSRYSRALVDFLLQKYSDAIAILTSITSEDPKNEDYLRLMARIKMASGNAAGASDAYTSLINLGVADANLYVQRAKSYRKTGELDKALKDLSKYLELYPENKEALGLTGRIESESGDNLKALDYFNRNLKLHPNDAECYIDRANTYFNSRSWNYAISDYSMSLDLQPANADVWMNKGIALLNSGKTEDACHDFREALSLGNKKAAAYISRNCIK
jgi:tetratricopeptide (TPR) repeat protein